MPRLLITGMLITVATPCFAANFIRGDANADGGVDLADAVFVLQYLFADATPDCDAALDANDDGAISISDPFQLLLWQFQGGTPPPFPFPGCGTDPTPTALSCTTFSCPALPALFSSMVSIPAGTFMMGDNAGLGTFTQELPVHSVTLDAFEMSRYHITNDQYVNYLNAAIVAGTIEVLPGGVVRKFGDTEEYCDTTTSDPLCRIAWNGSRFSVDPPLDAQGQPMGLHPMTCVSWHGAAAFLNWRSMQDGLSPCYDEASVDWDCNFTADGYRLPTEAEYEYAARGGQHAPYYQYPWGDMLDGTHANYWNSGDPYDGGTATTPVGYYDGNQVITGMPVVTDMANGYGLYDMVGNAWHWCNDWYLASYYSSSPSVNPTGPATGTTRATRGASFINVDPLWFRSAFRLGIDPTELHEARGFRAVRSVPQP